jgi:hypothetical protein
MEPGEGVLGDEIIEGPYGKHTLVVTTRAFYLKVGGQFSRYRYEDVKASTFDTHDVYLAFAGRMVRLNCRKGTAKSEALQSLRRQLARHRMSAV